MKASILWIEGRRQINPSLTSGLRQKGYYVEVVPNGKAAFDRLENSIHDLIIVDAASLRTSGKRICQELRAHSQDIPILLIANLEHPIPEGSYANVVLVPPFTLRKLLNRIVRLLPIEEKNILCAGPIRLDLVHKRVQCHNQQTRLTPRLAHLLQVLMQHPGEVLERENLFREVWDTDYIGDTRTLDVHISWLRHAIEPDPHHPKYIKTIRGVGYRLDI
jgi:DNA-binding response OmpR family regulator